MTAETTETAVRRLCTDLDRLRAEHQTLARANRELLEWGITSGTIEIGDRLRAICCEAQTIAVELHALGAKEEAFLAGQGWTRTPRTTASAVSS